MIIQSIERVRQLADCHVSQLLAPLVEHTDDCTTVQNWLCDADSKQAYARELSFVVLRQLIGDTSAVKYAGCMSLEVWQQYMQEATNLVAAGKIPVLEDANSNEYWKMHGITCTFVIGQYACGPVGVRKGEIVLDCGACNGDTAVWALQQGAAKVYSFEPDPHNFSLCQSNCAKFCPPDSFVCVQAGLGNGEGVLPFHHQTDNPAASSFASGGNIEVPITTLDIYCKQNKVAPTFIKMDVEGAEVSALTGAQGIIAAHKPQLAICLYHKVTDMWEIPMLIKAICPEYKFYCRKNNPFCEFVLYATV